MSYDRNGRIVGVDNTPTTSTASGIWTINAARDFVDEGIWPSPVSAVTLTHGETQHDQPGGAAETIDLTFANWGADPGNGILVVPIVVEWGTDSLTMVNPAISGGTITDSYVPTPNTNCAIGIYTFTGITGASGTLTVNWSGSSTPRVFGFAYRKSGGSDKTTRATQATDATISTNTLDISMNLTSGGAAVGVVGWAGANATTVWTGLTEDDDVDETAQASASAASISDATASTPLSITATRSGSTTDYLAAGIAFDG